MPASSFPQPVSAYLLLVILGFVPLILVSLFYDDLPHRLVVQWSAGGLTITGTRARSAMAAAVACAAIAVFAVIISAIQNKSLTASGIRRLFLALNFAQVLTIGLTVLMLVTEALGFEIRMRDLVPPSAALLLAIAALLCLRVSAISSTAAMGAVFGLAGWLFLAGAIAVCVLAGLFIGTPLTFAAIGVALLIALALAVPERAKA
jgi:hypothetical protein